MQGFPRKCASGAEIGRALLSEAMHTKMAFIGDCARGSNGRDNGTAEVSHSLTIIVTEGQRVGQKKALARTGVGFRGKCRPSCPLENVETKSQP